MELFFKLIGVGFIGTVAVVILKNTKPELSLFVAIATGILILVALSSKITEVFSFFGTLSEKSGLPQGVYSAIIRIIGIGYITEYSSSLAEDGGCQSIAKKLQLAGKVVILIMALPIINGIITLIEGLL